MLEEVHDFQTGGRDFSRMRDTDGAIHSVDMRYLDLLQPRRILYAYTMRLDAAPLSASLVTIDLMPKGEATSMIYTEQLTMLTSNAEQRRTGTGHGFDRLVLEMERALATLQ